MFYQIYVKCFYIYNCLNIWLKSLNQDMNITNIIRTTYYKKLWKQKKINFQKQELLTLNALKPCYVSFTNSNKNNNYAYPMINT